jgi:DNA-binding response OmpR family regulator
MKRHLVVIDDEKVIHSILERQLPVYDFEVHGCESGEEGLKYLKTLIKTTPIDVILLDWMMPNMSGLDVLAKLKRHRLMRDIPVFMLTSKSKLDDIDKAYDMGADNYITKPFSANSIGSIINLKLSKLKKRKELTGVK